MTKIEQAKMKLLTELIRGAGDMALVYASAYEKLMQAQWSEYQLKCQVADMSQEKKQESGDR